MENVEILKLESQKSSIFAQEIVRLSIVIPNTGNGFKVLDNDPRVNVILQQVGSDDGSGSRTSIPLYSIFLIPLLLVT